MGENALRVNEPEALATCQRRRQQPPPIPNSLSSIAHLLDSQCYKKAVGIVDVLTKIFATDLLLFYNVSFLPSDSYQNIPAEFISGRRSEPYDPYLPRNGTSSGPATAGPSQGNAKTAAIQAQIDDTVGIMRENITKVAERGERLEALQDKTGMYWMLHVWIGAWSRARSSA